MGHPEPRQRLVTGKSCVMGGGKRQEEAWTLVRITLLILEKCRKLHTGFESDRPGYDSLKKSLSGLSALAFLQRSCSHIMYEAIACGWRFLRPG